MSQNNSRQWYLQTEDGHNSGPFSDGDLQSMFQAGNIKLDTLAWCQELDGWQRLGDFPNTLRLHEKPETVSALGHYHVPAPPTVEQRKLRTEAQFQPKKVKQAAEPTSEIASDEGLYAGLWRRIIAYCIDTFVLTMAVVITHAIVRSVTGQDIFEMKMSQNWFLINLVSCFYFAWFHAKYCATPGKFLMEIKLVSTENEPISIAKGMLHALVFGALSNIIFLHVLIIAFTERKQGLHDLLCGTVVLNHKVAPSQ